jgi:hypothetical protein
MRKSLYVGVAVAVVLLACVFIAPASAHAAARKAASCPYPISSTTVTAWLQHGSPPAHVGMTLWVACGGGVYASANSFTESGFTITGYVEVIDFDGTYNQQPCPKAGVCNSHTIPFIGLHQYFGFYGAQDLPPTNQFYNCNPSTCSWGYTYFETPAHTLPV